MSLIISSSQRSFQLLRQLGTAPAAATAAAVSHKASRYFSSTPKAHLKDQLKSAPGWNEANASESEADIKADREPLPSNVKELQRESVEAIKEDMKADKYKSFEEKVEIHIHETSEQFKSYGKDFQRQAKDFEEKVDQRIHDASNQLNNQGKDFQRQFQDLEESITKQVMTGAGKVGEYFESIKSSLDGTSGKNTATKIKKKAKGVDDHQARINKQT
ncbi:hypothetical protein BGW38_007697 [Lunasporangiospora selenospora]|uniref:Uncharacterized protein n=1 Tax=Lunasporangiospora selenospora TaxID=979761 RepID=A0A9P6FYR4_9FUNG|nr:hypothetical protein BGW38_007697 [Lunasporangiospora selenospora]